MKSAKVFVLFVTMLLCTISLAAMASGSQDEGGTRLDNPVTTFGDGSSSKKMTFTVEPTTPQTATIKLPLNSRITDATISILPGMHSSPGGASSLDFSDTTNNQGWYGSDAAPTSKSPATLSGAGTSFSNSEYVNMDTADTIWTITTGAAASKHFHLYEFTVNATMKNLHAYWLGFSNTGSAMFTNLYSYCNTNTTWVLIGYNGNPVMAKQNYQISKDIPATQTSYVDASNKLYLMAVVDFSSMSIATPTIYTDYVSLNYSADSVMSWPSDPAIDVGDDGDDDWTHSGEFSTPATWNDASLASALQEAVDAGAGDPVDVVLKTSTATMGNITLQDISIGYYLNSPPTFTMDISNLVSFPEDGSGHQLVDILDHFTDDHDSAFRFDIEQRGGTMITAVKDPDGSHINFSAPPNWYGREEFRVKAYDTGLDAVYDNADDDYTYSNWFNVTVAPTDDAPVMEMIGATAVTGAQIELDAYEDQLFTTSASASDIDGDALEYISNSTLFLIDADTGLINVTPTQADVGVHIVNITVSEKNLSAVPKLWDMVELKITVHNTNDRPAITKFTPGGKDPVNYKPGSTVLRCFEDEPATWATTYLDPDGDACTFDANFTNARFSLDTATGEFSFAPLQEDVGDHYVNITVDDSTEKNWANIIIRVQNVNDVPEINDITHEGGVENLTVVFSTLEAFDEDGDELTYAWDLGDEGTGTGLSFSHDYAEAGNYTVKLTVFDGTAQNSTETVITVTAPLTPGDDDDVVDDDIDPNGTVDDDVDPNSTVDDDVVDDDRPDNKSSLANYWWLFVLLAVLIILVILIVVIIVVLKKRQADEEEQAGEPLPTPEQAADGGLAPAPVPMEMGGPGPAPVQEPLPPPAIPAQEQAYAPEPQPGYEEPVPGYDQSVPGYEEPMPEPELAGGYPALGAEMQMEQAPPAEGLGPEEGGFETMAVACYNCGGEIPVDTDVRPAILTCPNCGVEAQVD